MSGWFWDYLSATGSQSHGVCPPLGPGLQWLYILSDAATAFACFSVPVALLYFSRRRPDLLRRSLAVSASLVIVVAGVAHLLSIWTLLTPSGLAQGVVNLTVAGSAVFAAVAIWPIMPQLLAMPGDRDIEESRCRLAAEVAQRRHLEQRLAGMDAELERRVAQRTAALALSNKSLREARARADEANRAKSAFLAAMSHEIRTPMNGVIGMLGLMQREALDAEQQHYLSLAEESAHGLLSVINDILDYSRLEAGAAKLDKSVFSPAGAALKVAELMREAADRKHLRIEVEIGSDVPKEAVGDPLRLRQVLINLVGNAVKFTERGEIRIRVEAASGQLCYSVTDTGTGIPPELQDRLFERFTQGSESARRHGGSGLGLAICRALVGLMGGEIGVESATGVGTTVRFTVACGDAVRGSPVEPILHVVPEPGPSRPVAPQSVAGARILVVEDNAVNQLLVTKLLSRAGHKAVLAGDGETALSLLASQAFDLVLMDVQLPGMDGVMVANRMRKMPAPVCDLPVIALTANAMTGDRDRYLASGMDDYVSKPISAKELAAAIGRQLPGMAAEVPGRRIA